MGPLDTLLVLFGKLSMGWCACLSFQNFQTKQSKSYLILNDFHPWKSINFYRNTILTRTLKLTADLLELYCDGLRFLFCDASKLMIIP